MKHKARTVVSRALFTAVPISLVISGTNPVQAGFGTAPTSNVTFHIPDLAVGEIATLYGLQAAVGDTIAHLPSGPEGCDASGQPIGVIFAPGPDGMSVTLDIDAACDVVVSAVSHAGADVLDDVSGAVTLSPGAGLPALPATTDDAVPDAGLSNVDLTYAQGIVTCRHRAWTKSTILMREVWGWTTVAETRNQSTWSTTGRDGCYGRSVSNMVVDTNSKYSYCYTSDWDYSNNYGCWYRVKKGAPDESWSDLYGKWLINKNTLLLHSYVYSDTGSPYLGWCVVSDGNLPRDTKLDCHGRQDY